MKEIEQYLLGMDFKWVKDPFVGECLQSAQVFTKRKQDLYEARTHDWQYNNDGTIDVQPLTMEELNEVVTRSLFLVKVQGNFVYVINTFSKEREICHTITEIQNFLQNSTQP